ncbi:UDP-glucose 4-epimerase GalE [Deinococcus sp. SDU3-2]|uniref:UDP-glucose 4-epimerase n=1 Tax=Deinococcus terrestris TaxID=2651870 RepID=A0A7X1NZW8_9DEIO|nr:UDP-glucose 4-epimerase GalE [Deinococcus terrestris]MPY68376.1 UDP-glucose 4-epimerase GalE [Deinococcus terrestris]
MKVLVSGGAGYIGSTVCSALLDAGHQPVILDSLVTGDPSFVVDRVFYQGDISDSALVGRIFREHPDVGVALHFAARTVVAESQSNPGLYYRENVVKSLHFFELLITAGCLRVIFSSSASIYQAPPGGGVNEKTPLRPESPYGWSKLMGEQMLRNLTEATALRALALRYFNPIGADPRLRTGAQALNPSHILGQLLATASGRAAHLQITGTDYPTRDGTGLRDYIHVWDLAQAHVAAVERFDAALGAETFLPINLGTGQGVTVRELIRSFEAVTGQTVPQKEAPRRPGDQAGTYAEIALAAERLGWVPQLSTADAIASALAWEKCRSASAADSRSAPEPLAEA